MDTDAPPLSEATGSLASQARAVARRLITGELALVTAALILLTVIFFYDIVFLGRTLVTSSMVWGVMGSDPPWGYPAGQPAANPYLLDPLAHGLGFSTAQKAANLYRDLQLPLWDANTALGRPLFAGLDGQVMNPLRLPMVLSESPAAWDAFLMARFLVAGLFTYLFARRLGTNGIAALAAAVAFSFSGFFMVYINGQPPDFAMLVPVVLYSFELLFQRRRAGTIAFATVAVALSVLSGNPEGTFVLLLFGGGYYLARAATEVYRQGSLRPLRSMIPLGVCALLGIGLTAFALAPFIELSGVGGIGGHSVTLHHPERRLGLTFDSLRYLVSLFVPYFDGPPTSSFQGGGWTGIRNYVGVVVPLLAIMGLANRRLMSRGGWFFVVAAILLLGKTYGVGAVNWVGHLPFFNQMFFAVYFAPPIAFSLAMLAAFGVDQLMGRDIRTWHVLAGAGFLAALLGWLVWLNRSILDTIPGDHLAISLAFAGGVVLAAGVVTALGRWRVFSPQIAAILIVGLMTAELFAYTIPTKGEFAGIADVHGRSDLPLIHRPQRYDPFTEPPYLRFLERDRSAFRVFSPDYLLYPNTSSVYGIDDIRGYTAATVDRYFLYIQSFINGTVNQRYTGAPLPPLRSETEPSAYASNPLFDLLNVKYVIAGQDGALTEVYDHSFIDAVLAANPGTPGLALRAYRIQAQGRPVLFQHPPSSLSFDLTPREDSRFLLFSLAMDRQVWDRAGDGVQFEVSVIDGASSKVLLSRWVDPKNDPADRRWIDGAVDLRPYLGRDVTVVLTTSPGANPVWDWAGWGSLRLAASPELPPERIGDGQYKLVYEGEVNIYQNLSAFPRAFLVREALPAADMESAVELMQRPGFDPSSQAVVEGLPESTLASLAAAPASDRSTVKITHHGDSKVELRASMANPGLLALSDAYYPGWKAYVDGKETPIYPTDVALRSIYVGPGEHAITFEYDPASFRIGWMISVAALLALAGYAAYPTAKSALARYTQRPRP